MQWYATALGAFFFVFAFLPGLQVMRGLHSKVPLRPVRRWERVLFAATGLLFVWLGVTGRT